jgi:hypothetical protein
MMVDKAVAAANATANAVAIPTADAAANTVGLDDTESAIRDAPKGMGAVAAVVRKHVAGATVLSTAGGGSELSFQV